MNVEDSDSILDCLITVSGPCQPLCLNLQSKGKGNSMGNEHLEVPPPQTVDNLRHGATLYGGIQCKLQL